MSEHEHNDFSAVRSLGPVSENEYAGDYQPAQDARPLTNTSLRPVEVTRPEDPPMGSVQAISGVADVEASACGSSLVSTTPKKSLTVSGAGHQSILNLQETDAELGRRLIDFCSGLCYGLRGNMQRVGDRVFLVTPAEVQLTPDDHRLMRESGLLG